LDFHYFCSSQKSSTTTTEPHIDAIEHQFQRESGVRVQYSTLLPAIYIGVRSVLTSRLENAVLMVVSTSNSCFGPVRFRFRQGSSELKQSNIEPQLKGSRLLIIAIGRPGRSPTLQDKTINQALLSKPQSTFLSGWQPHPRQIEYQRHTGAPVPLGPYYRGPYYQTLHSIKSQPPGPCLFICKRTSTVGSYGLPNRTQQLSKRRPPRWWRQEARCWWQTRGR
jgi:hypothetical protein